MRKLAPLIGLVCCLPACADQFYVAAGFDCDTRASKLEVWFKGEWNEAGKALVASLDSHAINPYDLIQVRQDDKGAYSVSTRSVIKGCVLGREQYLVELAPMHSPRYTPEGFCAARVGARVKVSHRGKVIAERGVDACDETGSVTTRIHIRPAESPSYTDVPAGQFYADRN